MGNRDLGRRILDWFVVGGLEIFFFGAFCGFLAIRSIVLSCFFVVIIGGLLYGTRFFPRVRSCLSNVFVTHQKSRALIAILLVCTFPFLFNRNPYILHILLMCGIYALVNLGLNFQFGSLFLPNISFAAFYGIGAYSSAVLALKFGYSFWISMPIGGLMAALIGVLIGMPALRVKSLYYALTTLAFGVVFYHVLTVWNWVGASNGMINIPPPSLAGHSFGHSITIFGIKLPHQANFFYLTLPVLILGIFAAERLFNSKIGLA